MPHPPHPKSVLGRMNAMRSRWASFCQPGDDIMLFVDAGAEIERLQAELTRTRKHLKTANRALEIKALRLELLGRRMHPMQAIGLTPRQKEARHASPPEVGMGPADLIRRARAAFDGSPGVGAPPEVLKTALGAPLPQSDPSGPVLHDPKNLLGSDEAHKTTP